MVEGIGPDLMVAEGRPSMPGPTAVPMMRLTAAQKLLFLLLLGFSFWISTCSGSVGEMGRGLSRALQTGEWRNGLQLEKVWGCLIASFGGSSGH